MQWTKEFQKFAKNVKISSENDVERNDNPNVIHVHIASHSKLNSKNINIDSNIFTKVNWDRIVIDEAHVIRNKKSKLHKACKNLPSKIRWALSATPVMNKMVDFVHMLDWIGIEQNLCQNYTNIIVDTFTKRRTKDEVCIVNKKLQLPACHVEICKLQFETSLETNLYVHIYNEMRDEILKLAKHTNNTIRALELLLRVRQLCCHPQSFLDGMRKKYKSDKYNINNVPCTKLNKITDDISKIPDNDKAIVFCHFIKEMDEYCKVLENNGYTIARIDGSMDNDTRDLNKRNFDTKPKCRVMIVQINTAGVGYNFQVANHIYITSPTWNPSLQHQVIGRAHRTGQKKEVFVKVYCISSDNENETYIEDYILSLQQSKLKIIYEVLRDDRIAKDLTESKTSISFNDVLKMFKNKL